MSLRAVLELLEKQRLLEEMAHRQPLPRQEQVETQVHKQLRSDMRSLLSQLGTQEVVEILESLSTEEAVLVWENVPDRLADDVLHEIRGDVREILEEQHRSLSLNAFELSEGRLRQVPLNSNEDLDGIKPIWVDLVDPSKADREWIGDYFGLEIPDPDDLTDLEASARFYVQESGEIHLHSDFLLDREGDSRNIAVAFILYKDILFSVRSEELPVFRLQRLRARTQKGYVSDGTDMLLDLYAADAEYSADSLEETYLALGEVGKQVLNETMTDEEAAQALAAIAEQEDLNGRIRRNVLDTRRALTFLVRRKLLSAAQLEDAQQIVRDIESLDGHTAFLFDKINFLMDAIVGFVNVNQNRVIYRLTVLSVIFMPLNVIAGIFGMSEFTMMTGNIPWALSYAIFTVGMVLVAWLTYFILRRYEKRTARKKSGTSTL
ncbi:magnesium transporter CorA [Geomonas sp. RF6]|uniref:magnesium and cobalt transport protein CorA n=1 Tax=Geomonas sp. RF6 TaxID=2897342 RepID=UPI001E6098CF|nr:magnesium and cobalt transport protein CorA [Geomonas sp. RF6]UFS70209.1 magnesium transporter CorA [Geomonas sp. RF6]